MRWVLAAATAVTIAWTGAAPATATTPAQPPHLVRSALPAGNPGGLAQGQTAAEDALAVLEEGRAERARSAAGEPDRRRARRGPAAAQ